MTRKFFSYRSGIEEAWKCPRNGYLNQFHLGTGIQRAPRPVWLDTGNAVHFGLAQLIQGADPKDAIGEALRWFEEDSGQKLWLKEYTFLEQYLMVEALLWSFVLHSLEAFLSTYVVLWVEKEIIQEIPVANSELAFDFVRTSRPDAICMDRTTGEVAIISWKTIDSPTEYRRRFYKHDLQGLMEMHFSEMLFKERAVEIKREIAQAAQELSSDDVSDAALDRLKNLVDERKTLPKQADYVQTIFLVKGKRQRTDNVEPGTVWDDNSEDANNGFGYGDTDDIGPNWRTDSFLVYPWVRKGGTDSPKTKREEMEGVLVAWTYRYAKPNQASFSTLGKAFERVFLPLTQLPVELWVRSLHEKKVFPSTFNEELDSPLSKVIVWDEPCHRDRIILEDIVEQTKSTEIARFTNLLRFEERAKQLEKLCPEDEEYNQEFAKLLALYWPQSISACSQPWKCQFQPVCFSVAPINWRRVPELFEERVPHHEPELVYIQGLKGQ